MFQIKIGDLGFRVTDGDTSVLKADTKPELRRKVGRYLSTTYADRWAAMSEDERQRLHDRAAEIAEQA